MTRTPLAYEDAGPPEKRHIPHAFNVFLTKHEICFGYVAHAPDD